MQKHHPIQWLERPIAALVASVAVLTGAALVAHADEPAAAVADDDGEAAKIRQYVFAMEKAYDEISDYTTTMHKQERVKGHLLPREELQVKFRKPFGIYLKWIGEVNHSREVIFVKGWNDDKLRAHKGSFPDMTVNLKPDSSLAMQGNRHNITEAHFGRVVELIARDARLSESRPQDVVRYIDLGEKIVHGARSRCIEARTPASGVIRIYYAARAKVCFDVRTRMPTQITVWNDNGSLLEDYGFSGTKINVGLTDADFDPDNAAYNF